MRQDLELELKTGIAEYLAGLCEKLVEALALIAQQDHPPETFVLLFQYDSTSFTDHFAVMLLCMDNRETPIQDTPILPDEPCTIPSELLDDEEYDEAGLNPWSIASEVFEPWFADCWDAAKGNEIRVPAYLSHHDSYFYYDLRNRKRVKEPELGFHK